MAGGSVSDPAHAQRLAAYVGPNADYYLRKWAELERGGSTSWNFAAFFLSAFWLAYRKMVVPALVVVAIFFGVFLIETAGEVRGLSFISLLAAIGVGLFGNKLYRNQAEAAVAASGGDPARLHAAGGISWPYGIGLAAAYGALATGAVMYMMEERIGPFRRGSTYRPYVSPSSGSSDLVTHSWLVGRWGTSGSNCMTWLSLSSSGTLIDNVGVTGTWSLSGSQFTMIANGRTSYITVSRRGETMIFSGSGGRQEWVRC